MTHGKRILGSFLTALGVFASASLAASPAFDDEDAASDKEKKVIIVNVAQSDDAVDAKEAKLAKAHQMILKALGDKGTVHAFAIVGDDVKKIDLGDGNAGLIKLLGKASDGKPEVKMLFVPVENEGTEKPKQIKVHVEKVGADGEKPELKKLHAHLQKLAETATEGKREVKVVAVAEEKSGSGEKKPIKVLLQKAGDESHSAELKKLHERLLEMTGKGGEVKHEVKVIAVPRDKAEGKEAKQIKVMVQTTGKDGEKHSKPTVHVVTVPGDKETKTERKIVVEKRKDGEQHGEHKIHLFMTTDKKGEKESVEKKIILQKLGGGAGEQKREIRVIAVPAEKDAKSPKGEKKIRVRKVGEGSSENSESRAITWEAKTADESNVEVTVSATNDGGGSKEKPKKAAGEKHPAANVKPALAFLLSGDGADDKAPKQFFTFTPASDKNVTIVGEAKFAFEEDDKDVEKHDPKKSDKPAQSKNVIDLTEKDGTIVIGPVVQGDGKLKLLAKLANANESKETYLGVSPEAVPEVFREQLKALAAGEDADGSELLKAMKGGYGVVVARVIDDSPAAKAGVKKNDILTRFDGAPVKSPDQLKELVTKKKKGDVAALTLVRGGQTVELKVTLTEHASPVPTFARVLTAPELHDNLHEKLLKELKVENLQKHLDAAKKLHGSEFEWKIDIPKIELKAILEKAQDEAKQETETARKQLEILQKKLADNQDKMGDLSKKYKEALDALDKEQIEKALEDMKVSTEELKKKLKSELGKSEGQTKTEKKMRSISLSTSDGKSFKVSVSYSNDDGEVKEWSAEGTTDEIFKKMESLPAELRDTIKGMMKQSQPGKSKKPGLIYQVRPDGQQSYSLVLEHVGDKGLLEKFELSNLKDLELLNAKLDASLPKEAKESLIRSLKSIKLPKIEVETEISH